MRSHVAPDRVHRFSPKTDRGTCGKEPIAGDVPGTRTYVESGGLMSYGASFRLVPARRDLCGQNP